jgi:hypothetical protein
MKTKSKPKRQPKPKPDLNAVDLRILEAVMRQPGMGVRDLIPIAERSIMACWASMEKLRHLGLVTWDCGRQKTLRATCKFLPKGTL